MTWHHDYPAGSRVAAGVAPGVSRAAGHAVPPDSGEGVGVAAGCADQSDRLPGPHLRRGRRALYCSAHRRQSPGHQVPGRCILRAAGAGAWTVQVFNQPGIYSFKAAGSRLVIVPRITPANVSRIVLANHGSQPVTLRAERASNQHVDILPGAVRVIPAFKLPATVCYGLHGYRLAVGDVRSRRYLRDQLLTSRRLVLDRVPTGRSHAV